MKIQRIYPKTTCYAYKFKKDVAVIELNADLISGYYSWTPYEKDSARGSFKGEFDVGFLTAIFTYSIEGAIQKEEITFQMGSDSLTQGRGELVESKSTGVLMLKDHSKVVWENEFKKVDCSTVAKDIEIAKEVAQSISKQK